MNPPSNLIRIRPMVLADLDPVTAIAQSLSQAPHWAREVYVKALHPDAQPRRIALVAEGPESRIVGFVVAALISPQAELETIAVSAGVQRQGVGRQLFSALAAGLKASQITEVLLEVRASNQPAQALYRALGFQQTGCRPRYYAEPQEDAILMHLSIG